MPDDEPTDTVLPTDTELAMSTPRPGDTYVQSFARGLQVIRSFSAQAPQQTLSEVEWHLLWPRCVTVLHDLSASLGTRHLQPRIGFGPSLSHSWFDSSGPMADFALGD